MTSCCPWPAAWSVQVVVPDMRKFGFPRRCAKSVEKKIKDICDSGSMHDGAHDVDDGTPFVIV